MCMDGMYMSSIDVCFCMGMCLHAYATGMGECFIEMSRANGTTSGSGCERDEWQLILSSNILSCIIEFKPIIRA